MRRLLSGLLGLLLGCLSCTEPPPPATTADDEDHKAVATNTPPAKGEEVADGMIRVAAEPTLGQVDVEIRGLVAFVPMNGGLRSLFLSPASAKHEPLLAIHSGRLAKENASDPDLVATGPAGEGFAIWKFKSASLDPSNVAEKTLEFNTKRLEVGDKNLTKPRWVPFLHDILGSYEAHDPKEAAKAAAIADWNAGEVSPIFDSRAHETDPWTIGERKATAIADGVRVRATLADAGKPVGLSIMRGGKSEVILVKGGTKIEFSAYPTTLPKPDEKGMKHFHHFYKLRSKDKTGPDPKGPEGTTPNPARCAPIIFGNPE